MKLSEIFDQLTYGELSQVSLGGGDAGKITQANYKQVLAHINLGLTSLYKRFPLKENRVVVELQHERVLYPLTRAYALNSRDSKEPERHIIDSYDAPFQEDILKIERVLTDADFEMGLNNEADLYSCFTPSLQMLRVSPLVVSQAQDVPQHLRTSNLTLVYRANHIAITAEAVGADPSLVDVEIPYSHLEPLLLFVASRVHNPIGMANEFHAGNSYYAKYEAACQQLEQVNIKVDQGSQSSRLRSSGWV